jgi:hypothetical protein
MRAYLSRAAVALSARSTTTRRSTATLCVATLTSNQVVRTLGGGSGASCARCWVPDLDVVGETKELRSSLNTSVSGNKGCHQGGGENLGETHYFDDINSSISKTIERFG